MIKNKNNSQRINKLNLTIDIQIILRMQNKEINKKYFYWFRNLYY